MHASFFPQLEDVGGEVLVTPGAGRRARAAGSDVEPARTTSDTCNGSAPDGLSGYMFLFGTKTRMVDPENALPGRPDPIRTPDTHFVLGTPLKPPFPDGLQTAVVGMGCFWGAERVFWQVPGVYTTAVGYAGGYTPNPTYEETCSGKTGHTEAVLVVFDPAKITYEEILKLFWEGHDPTQAHAPGQRRRHPVPLGDLHRRPPSRSRRVEASKAAFGERLRDAGYGEIATEIAPLGEFYYAEDYHQQYLARCRTATAASAAPASPARDARLQRLAR